MHESIYDDVAEAIAAQAREVVVGDGLDEETQLGPIQNLAQLEIVKSLAQDAKDQGGNFLTGGNQIDRPGYFFEPTVVTGLSNGSRLVDEEPFGPIVPIIKYSDIDEVLERANDSESGLGGSIWSSDPEKAAELVARMECGTVWVNDHAGLNPNAPFGGIKQSGFGVEFGDWASKSFLRFRLSGLLKRKRAQSELVGGVTYPPNYFQITKLGDLMRGTLTFMYRSFPHLIAF